MTNYYKKYLKYKQKYLQLKGGMDDIECPCDTKASKSVITVFLTGLNGEELQIELFEGQTTQHLLNKLKTEIGRNRNIDIQLFSEEGNHLCSKNSLEDNEIYDGSMLTFVVEENNLEMVNEAIDGFNMSQLRKYNFILRLSPFGSQNALRERLKTHFEDKLHTFDASLVEDVPDCTGDEENGA